MQIFRHVEEVPEDFGPVIASIGNFDGIHRAHQTVIDEIVRRARSSGAKSMIITFDPHPVRILRPDAGLLLITPFTPRFELLQALGIDALLLLPFTRDLSLLSPQEFMQQILLPLNVKEIHEGFNFHFGHRAQGDVDVLKKFGAQHGFEVKIYPEMRMRGREVSSSQVRNAVQSGQVGHARHLLGRVFFVKSLPGRGRGYGHKYTVPTINLTRYDELIPKDGVYVTRSRIGKECFDSVTNIGVRPTFGQDSFAIESHLLNFHPIELTAETPVELSFLRRIRDEIKFPSVEALRDQIAKDVHYARRYFHLMRVFSKIY